MPDLDLTHLAVASPWILQVIWGAATIGIEMWAAKVETDGVKDWKDAFLPKLKKRVDAWKPKRKLP